MGEVTPTKFEQATMSDEKGESVPVVKVKFSMNQPVEKAIYEYLVNSDGQM